MSLFNRGGYVLNFSDSTFEAFCMASVGISVQAKYGLSKGKSLNLYLTDADTDDNSKIKLLSSLLEYYEIHYQHEIEADLTPLPMQQDQYKKYYQVCKESLRRVMTSNLYTSTMGENLIDVFNSEYIQAQIVMV